MFPFSNFHKNYNAELNQICIGKVQIQLVFSLNLSIYLQGEIQIYNENILISSIQSHNYHLQNIQSILALIGENVIQLKEHETHIDISFENDIKIRCLLSEHFESLQLIDEEGLCVF